jgi:hypothetical protein
MKKQKKIISAEELEKKFDNGEDISPYLDWSKARIDHPNQRINLDLPSNILKKIDKEADRIGVTRTSLIKVWISHQVDRLSG